MFLKNSEPPKLNGLVVTYIAIASLLVIVDYFKLVEYYVVRQSNIVNLEVAEAKQLYNFFAIVLSLGLLSVAAVVIRKYSETLLNFIFFPKLNGSDWGVIIFFFAITLLRLPFPDYSFDVLNYHLYLQDIKFENAIAYNFFPASSATFLFPLGDRLFYIFRLLLGYRGGALLNTLVLIILYFQLKDILKLFPALRTIPNNGLLLCLSALFILSTEALLAYIGIYMIDLLMVPFLVELLRLAIVREAMSPEFTLVYGSLMVGLSISIKMTSIIFCAWIFIAIVYRYYREISLKITVISLLILAFPLLGYVTYNFTQTHNPIFPLFNTFFKSPYFPNKEFNTDLWATGPQNLFEFIFWPVYMFFQPQRQFWIFPYDSGRICLGFLVAIGYLSIGLFKKKTNLITIGLFVIGSTYSWVYLLNGEKRYGLIFEIISGILIIDFLCNLFGLSKNLLRLKIEASSYSYQPVSFGSRHQLLQSWQKLVVNFGHNAIYYVGFLTVSVVVAALAQVMYAYNLSIITNVYDYSQRGRTLSVPKAYFQQLNMIGKDYLPLRYPTDDRLKEVINEIDAWILLPVNMDVGSGPTLGFAKLLKDNIPILNLGYARVTPASFNAFLTLKQKSDLRMKNVYTVSLLPMDVLEHEADRYGVKIISVYEIQPTFIHVPVKLVKVVLK